MGDTAARPEQFHLFKNTTTDLSSGKLLCNTLQENNILQETSPQPATVRPQQQATFSEDLLDGGRAGRNQEHAQSNSTEEAELLAVTFPKLLTLGWDSTWCFA